MMNTTYKKTLLAVEMLGVVCLAGVTVGCALFFNGATKSQNVAVVCGSLLIVFGVVTVLLKWCPGQCFRSRDVCTHTTSAHHASDLTECQLCAIDHNQSMEKKDPPPKYKKSWNSEFRKQSPVEDQSTKGAVKGGINSVGLHNSESSEGLPSFGVAIQHMNVAELQRISYELENKGSHQSEIFYSNVSPGVRFNNSSSSLDIKSISSPPTADLVSDDLDSVFVISLKETNVLQFNDLVPVHKYTQKYDKY